MEENKFKVYIKINEDDEIVDVNSELFIDDFSGWIEIDEGVGDRFAHAQSHYFGSGLRANDREKIRYNYKYVDGEIRLS